MAIKKVDSLQNYRQDLESKAMMVLRFIGFMYWVEPVMICCTIILFAFSDGWNGSQNA